MYVYVAFPPIFIVAGTCSWPSGFTITYKFLTVLVRDLYISAARSFFSYNDSTILHVQF